MKATDQRRRPFKLKFAQVRVVPATFTSIVGLFLAQPVAAEPWDIGALPGSTGSISAQAISGNGKVVVGRIGGGQDNQLFIWSASQGFTGLGSLISNSHANALAVSYDGSVIAGNLPNGDIRAVRWTAATGFVDLGDLGGSYSLAHGISNDGNVVVGYSATTSTSEPERAYRWTTTSGMQDLGTLRANESSKAWGVSGDGQVVVGESGSSAFRWTAAAGITDLGNLGGISVARAANNDGSVVVGQSNNLAFRWTESGGMQGLGLLSGYYSAASDVNADGSVVVGTATESNGDGRAFRWTEATGMLSLGVLSGQAWSAATGVSDDGNTVVGVSGNRSFIWKASVTPDIPGNPGNPDGTLQDLAYLQTSVIQSADAVNHLISTQKRRLRDSAQQQCLPGAAQSMCLSAGGSAYFGEADTTGHQRNAEFAAGLRLNEQYSIGANLTAGRADVREQSAEQRKAFAFGLWAAYQQNAAQLGWGASVSAAAGQSNNGLERGTGLSDVQRARVELDMSGAALRVAANYGVQMGKSLVTPELALSHVRTRQNGFTERDVALPLTIGATDSQESLATLGVQAASPVTPKGTVHVGFALDALLHEDTVAVEGRSAVPGFSHFQLDSTLNKRRVLPSAMAGYSHALTANSSIGGNVQVSSSVYKGAQPVAGAGVHYRYAF